MSTTFFIFFVFDSPFSSKRQENLFCSSTNPTKLSGRCPSCELIRGDPKKNLVKGKNSINYTLWVLMQFIVQSTVIWLIVHFLNRLPYKVVKFFEIFYDCGVLNITNLQTLVVIRLHDNQAALKASMATGAFYAWIHSSIVPMMTIPCVAPMASIFTKLAGIGF